MVHSSLPCQYLYMLVFNLNLIEKPMTSPLPELPDHLKHKQDNMRPHSPPDVRAKTPPTRAHTRGPTVPSEESNVYGTLNVNGEIHVVVSTREVVDVGKSMYCSWPLCFCCNAAISGKLINSFQSRSLSITHCITCSNIL